MGDVMDLLPYLHRAILLFRPGALPFSRDYHFILILKTAGARRHLVLGGLRDIAPMGLFFTEQLLHALARGLP